MKRWLPLVTICLGTLMLLIDVTIVNVALPDMIKDLHASFGAVQWVVDAYALVLAALVLGAGSIADLVGHRRAYVAGLVLFAVASFVCGISPNPGVLITARAVQGIGGAAMFATTFALLNSNYQGRDRGLAYGLWGAVAGASASVGPILGGLLTELTSWRWIFFVNLPISVLAIVLCVRALTDVHEPRRSRIDVAGIVTFTGSAAAVTYALIRANEQGWSNPLVWWMLGAFVVLLAVFVLVERHTPYAMLDLALLRNSSFVGVLLAAGLLSLAAFAVFTYTSIWLQSVIGLSPIEAGLVGLPMSVTAFVVSGVLGRLLHRAEPGRLIGFALVFIGVGDLVAAAMTHGSASWPALILGLFVSGIGVGLGTPTLGSAAMSAVPVQRGGMAAGAVNTTRQLGFALGVALLGSAFTARAQAVLSDHHVSHAAGAARAIAGGQSARLLGAVPASARDAVHSAIHDAAVSGVQTAFIVAGGIGLLGAVLSFTLVRGTTSQATGEPEPGAEDDGMPAADPELAPA